MGTVAYDAGLRATSGHSSNETGSAFFGRFTSITTPATAAANTSRTTNLLTAFSALITVQDSGQSSGHFCGARYNERVRPGQSDLLLR